MVVGLSVARVFKSDEDRSVYVDRVSCIVTVVGVSDELLDRDEDESVV